VADIGQEAWEQVAGPYGYEPDDGAERRHVVQLVHGMIGELADMGAVAAAVGDDAVLTDLGTGLAVLIALNDDDDHEGELTWRTPTPSPRWWCAPRSWSGARPETTCSPGAWLARPRRRPTSSSTPWSTTTTPTCGTWASRRWP